MGRRRRPSKKPSAASSIAKPPESATFYLDEAIYSKVLVQAMRDAGARVRHAGEAFPFGTPDEVWLAAAGEHSWIVLTRDQRIRQRRLELDTLLSAEVAAFAFTGGQATALETARLITRLLRKLANMSISEPRPFLYTFGFSGRLTKIKLRAR